jgi:hypothetical protein
MVFTVFTKQNLFTSVCCTSLLPADTTNYYLESRQADGIEINSFNQ